MKERTGLAIAVCLWMIPMVGSWDLNAQTPSVCAESNLAEVDTRTVSPLPPNSCAESDPTPVDTRTFPPPLSLNNCAESSLTTVDTRSFPPPLPPNSCAESDPTPVDTRTVSPLPPNSCAESDPTPVDTRTWDTCVELQCPGEVLAYACGTDCVPVDYAAVVTNHCDLTNLAITYDPPSGSCFYLGTHLVHVTVTDSGGHTNHCEFPVTVLPDPNCDPDNPCVELECPGNVIAYACGTNCVPVDYAAVVTNHCDLTNLAITYDPPSGSCFYLGTHLVHVTATDGGGHTNHCEFLVTVLPDPNCNPVEVQVVFSNDFETDTHGFVADGSLTGLSRVRLPTDSGGPTSTNTSMWLGKLGDGVPKSGATEERVTLNLSGLVPGTDYQVAFDLLIGASWDGAASCCGPDSWRFEVDGRRLVDTIFSNGQSGVNVGAYSPQRYSDTNYSSPNGPDVPRFTGADASWSANQGGNYANDYAIYYFGHGEGNPVLTFTATGTTATLRFVRYGNTSDSADEYWALDNVVITGAPPPPQLEIQLVTNQVLLSWTTNAPGFRLQASSGLGSAWASIGTSPAVADDSFVVKDTIANTARFYRLIK